MEWLGSGSEDDDDEDEEDGDDDDDDEDGMETDWYHPAVLCHIIKKIHAESFFYCWNFFSRVLLIGPGSMKSLTEYKYPVKDLVWKEGVGQEQLEKLSVGKV